MKKIKKSITLDVDILEYLSNVSKLNELNISNLINIILRRFKNDNTAETIRFNEERFIKLKE